MTAVSAIQPSCSSSLVDSLSGHSLSTAPLLERLFSESVGDLTKYFMRRHGAEDRAADLVQETFLQLARSLQDGRKVDCARGYLFGIARRVSQAAWSRNSRERENLSGEVIPFYGRNVDSADATGATNTDQDDRIDLARETMASLAPLQREILDLRFSQELSYAEIAAALGIPVGTVRSRLHHAVAELRRRLEPGSD